MYWDLTLRKLAYGIVLFIGLGYLFFVGSSIIMPLLFAFIFSVFLYPIDAAILSVVKIRGLSILFTFLAVIVPLLVIGYLFSLQLSTIVDSLPEIGSGLQQGLDSFIDSVSAVIPVGDFDSKDIIPKLIENLQSGPFGVVRDGVVSSGNLLVAISLCMIYVFFFLFYRKSFRKFLLYQFEKEFRPELKDTMSEIRKMVQSYIGGLGIVILVLSVCNSIGLWIIGVDYPIFWGTLAGFLAVIPYIGTVLGGLLPFIYSLATADYSWQPIAVVAYYMMIQFVEGNLITPKIVGDKVNINPLFAILSIVIFGAYWGVGGVILALPLISIIRIILSQFENTKPYAILLSSDVYEDTYKFKRLAND